MNVDQSELKPHEWKLIEAVGGLFHDAAKERDREAAAYYWKELEHLKPTFSFVPKAEPSVPSLTVTIPEKVQEVVKSVAARPKPERESGKWYKSRPFSESQKVALTAALLTEEPPETLEGLTRLVHPASYKTREEDARRNGFIVHARCPKTLVDGLARLRVVLESGKAHPSDEEFIGQVRVRFPKLTPEAFNVLAHQTLEKYGIDPVRFKFTRYGGEGENGAGSVLEFQPKAEWLQVLNIALFHREGASVDPAVIAHRLGISVALAKPIFDGALKALRQYWLREEVPDEETERFMDMIEARWRIDSLDEIFETIRRRAPV